MKLLDMAALIAPDVANVLTNEGLLRKTVANHNHQQNVRFCRYANLRIFAIPPLDAINGPLAVIDHCGGTSPVFELAL
jgi:hypothetical protein